jgi:rhamnosyl/mannosyltransferase
MSEAVIDGKSGILVPPAEVDQLAKAIATLANDDTLRREYGEYGRERMVKEFSIDAMADKHVALYESVVNG